MKKLLTEKGEPAGLWDVIEWWVATYPPDIFLTRPSQIVRIRGLMQDLYDMREDFTTHQAAAVILIALDMVDIEEVSTEAIARGFRYLRRKRRIEYYDDLQIRNGKVISHEFHDDLMVLKDMNFLKVNRETSTVAITLKGRQRARVICLEKPIRGVAHALVKQICPPRKG